MPIQLVCPLCGDELKCEKAHEGPYDVPPEIVKCAPTKGGLHVVVRDNHQKGVPGVKVYSDGSGKGNGDSTDDLGFAYFEQLPAKDYPTRIVLDESAKDVREGYYTETRVSVSAEVKAGQITMVEFALIKYATMLVILERKDKKSDLPGATFEVTSDKHKLAEPSKPAQDGKAPFEKLKPTALYTVKCKLDEKDEKNFQLVENKDVEADQKVTSAGPNEVVFLVEPRFWVDLVLQDLEDDKVKGTFRLKQPGTRVEAAGVGRDVKHRPGLESGTVEIEGVQLTTESREFVELT